MATATAPAAGLDSLQEQQPGQQGQAAKEEQKQQQQPTGKKQRARARQVAAELRNGRPALWWKDRPSYRCPACGQYCYRVPAFETHILRCCPDVALPDEWRSLVGDAEAQQAAQQGAAGPAVGQAVGQADEQAAQQQQQAAAGGSGGRGSDGEQEQGPPAWQLHPADAAIREWLKVVERREEEQRAKALDVAFRQRGPDGEPLKQGPPEIAAALGLPPERAAALLAAAKRAVPLAADTDHPVEVLYEDDDLIAVNKPPFVITAPKHRYIGGSMVNRIIGTMGFEPLTLHRLDMNTTGVVLFAKKKDIVDRVHAQFRRKTVRKQYLALAVGVPQQQHFTVDAPIDRDPEDVVARRVLPDGKPALTEFSVVESAAGADLASQGSPASRSDAALAAALQAGGLSLVSCRPLTGRTHQIRVHLAHAGHAILGDDIYGVTGPWIGRHALHAAAITITHPRTGEPLTVRSPVPPDFLQAMAQLGLQHVPGAEFSPAAGEEGSAAPADAAAERAAGVEAGEQEATAAPVASSP
ncbi:hypothetical protein ABPG77_005654 [Micractinium sp. CCAP 211/92]